ncbi:hypothetical protein [Streptomyces sp. TS71-3]|uniref:hypothetical protein n=1 Tax=Streptomyces sp. TS71-3 TaxID=2733862 RepID=UPI00201743D4|nr:hypothetical protein [Streptomyces sp. TS71-3]
MDDRALREFLVVAMREYRLITEDAPLPCFALAIGTAQTDTVHIQRVAFARNARTYDPAACREFAESIVPTFGPAYENENRGWWIDSGDLLRLWREAEGEGLDIVGSIHMHPDWHRLGPPCERTMVLNERPTPMDRHVYRNTAWPINVICYLERRAGDFYHTLAAWAPPPLDEPDADCTELPLRIRTADLVGVGADAGGSR